MDSEAFYRLLADTLLTVHFAYVIFVVAGLLCVILGGIFSWAWVRNPVFRYLHLCAIGIVVLQSWLGLTCPLTSWEVAFRAKAGDLTYSGSFVAYWLDKLLYYQGPEWVFILLYSAFGALVVASWYFVRPRKLR